MRNWLSRLRFWLAYRWSSTPWDTNVTPPELVETVEGPNSLPPGRALDLGCGTGTNVIYLAQQGWEAIGVDFVAQPIDDARAKARSAGVTARFFQGDVTRLGGIDGIDGRFDLVLDIGCFHTLSEEGRARYAHGLLERLRPGGTYLLYAWSRRPEQEGRGGASPQEVKATFVPHLELRRVEHGSERKRPSAWYWFASPAEK